MNLLSVIGDMLKEGMDGINLSFNPETGLNSVRITWYGAETKDGKVLPRQQTIFIKATEIEAISDQPERASDSEPPKPDEKSSTTEKQPTKK